VTAKDVAGNSATSGAVAVNITRFKWARTLPIGKIKASPIVTPAISGTRLLLVGGDATGTAGSTTTIASLNTSGGVLTGVGGTGALTNNMVYSPATKTLYTASEGTQKLFAFSAAASGLSAGYTCDLGTGKTINGSPAVITSSVSGVPTEFAVVGESSAHKLWALTGSGGACDFGGATVSTVVGTGSVRSPTTDGSNIYVQYQGRGVAKVPLTAGALVSVTTKDLAATGAFGGASLVGANFFLANSSNYQSYTTDFSGTVSGIWTNTGTNGAMNDLVASSPVINGGLVVGTAGINDGVLRVFNASDGAPAFSYTAGTTVSQVAIDSSATPVYYFTDGNGQLNAISRVSNGSTAAIAAKWTAPFTGATGGVPFTGSTGEPTLASDGTLYFGADNGTVYAIATDSPGGAVPTGGTNWPRVGFDNCNSNNSSLTNCQ
jgi:hypothetical protein